MNAKTKTAAAAEQVATPVDTENEEHSMLDSLRLIAEMSGFTVPTGNQMLGGTVTLIVVGLLGSYAAMQLASYAMVGAVLFTGSMFLGWMALILTAALALYAAGIAASKAAAYVATGGLERDVVAAKNWVTGWFKRDEKVAA